MGYENPFAPSQSGNFAPAQTYNTDPFGVSAMNFAPQNFNTANPFPAAQNFNTSPLPGSQMGSSFNFAPQQTSETLSNRESLISKLRGGLGRIADKLAGLTQGAQKIDVATHFGAGGTIDRGIMAAHGQVNRVDQMANSGTANMLKKIPGLGKHVETVQSLTGAAAEISGMASQYGNMASAVTGLNQDRGAAMNQAAGYAREAGMRVAGAGVSAAMESFGNASGVTMERGDDGQNKLKVQKGKLAKFALKAVFSGGKNIVGAGREAVVAGANGARSAAQGEVAMARGAAMGAVQTAAETGSFWGAGQQFNTAPVQPFNTYTAPQQQYYEQPAAQPHWAAAYGQAPAPQAAPAYNPFSQMAA